MRKNELIDMHHGIKKSIEVQFQEIIELLKTK